MELEPQHPVVVPRSEHPISRHLICDEALKVLYRLRQLDYKAYLVGGGVRDLYLGKKPKDFDIATDARPSRLKKIFRNCRIIGRRFRIAHVFFPNDVIIEVSTFRRGEVQTIEKDSGGVILLDNEYGTPEEDAKRRDLTINGLFYDIETFSIIDYVGGVADLDARLIRTIKDPDASFKEDPVRMIRALRHASRIAFHLEDNTHEAIRRNRLEILKANPSRLMEEFFKDLRSGTSMRAFQGFQEVAILQTLLPSLSAQLTEHGAEHPLWRRLDFIDRWVQAGRPITSPVLIAHLLHTVLLPIQECWTAAAPNPRNVWNLLQKGFAEAGQHIRISRRDIERVFQLVLAFPKLSHFVRAGELGPTYQKKSYLGEALDFLEIDLLSRGLGADILAEWREVYVKALPPRPPEDSRSRRGRRRGGRGRARGPAAGARPRPERAAEPSAARGEGGPRRKKRRRRRGGRGGASGGAPAG